ncbi:UNVERIFIED_CONTAM: hypothetical protein Sradi_5750400 [Sesamum radiatum]|uniref:Uncharacterized protein n=1 Tax=Sesamum radiatum TaxID=300843 RepID=A0AAW2L6P1_SESRA
MENTLRTLEETQEEGSTGIYPVFSEREEEQGGLENSKSNFQYQGMCEEYTLYRSPWKNSSQEKRKG